MMKRILAGLLVLSLAFSPAYADQVANVTLEPGITGTDLRTQQNDINDAFNTTHKGSSAPGSIDTGTMWLDDSGGATSWLLKLYDGSDNISVGTFNTTANTFTPSGQLATFANAVSNKTANYTILSGDYGKLITFDATSGAITASVDAIAGLGSSWYVIIQKIDSSANAVTIDPNSSETINGAATLALARQFDSVIVIKDGSTFRAPLLSEAFTFKVSSDDTTPAYLEDKLTAGNGIDLATASGGANETRSVTVGLATDPGLEFNSGDLRIKAGTAIIRNSSGINVDVGTSAGDVVQLDGSAKLPAVDGSQLTNLPASGSDNQVFTSSGTWNKPSGYATTARVLIEAWGAGGGGGSGSGSASPGGNSSFGSFLTAYGGGGGAVNSSLIGGSGGGYASVGSSGTNDTGFEGYGNRSFSTQDSTGGFFTGGGGGGGNTGATGDGRPSVYGGGGGGGNSSRSGGSSQFAGAGGNAPAGAATAPAGGGAGGNSGGGGGGGGSYKYRWVKLSDLGSTESVTVGTGGAAGGGANNGSAGARGEVRVTVF